ncbi:Metallo-dependent phosphatase-like protein [Lipomyces chichibuensis]|uniref:Metallo-dependent phosphatase-like protein n=1 Tax=Lipomyces chichibuensis TaxID=1546026 RepID=UPI003343E178
MPTYEASYPPNLYHASRPRATRRGPPFQVPSLRIGNIQLGHIFKKLFTLVNALRLLWVVVLVWGERRVIERSIRACQWENWEHWPEGATPERVVLVADPQLVDDNTYPGRNSLFLGLTEFYVDTYMHRAWQYVETILSSDATIFLGDLFDGGRRWDHEKWMAEYKRFLRIFPIYPGKLTLFEVAGNHDIGLGDTIVVEALQRFTAYFGEPSREIEIGNHSVVILDTDSMMNTNNEDIYGPPRAFFDALVKRTDEMTLPRIVLSHIPFYRPPDTPCGPKREGKPALPISRGHQYQTVLNSELSLEILEKLHPVAIFSGDDHDACRHIHSYSEGARATVEFTVKTFSIAMGVSYPAIEMVSLWNPGESRKMGEPTFQTKLCLLPSQFDIFRQYFKALVLTFVLTFLGAARAWRASKKYGKAGLDHLGSDKDKGSRVYRTYPTAVKIVLAYLQRAKRNKWVLWTMGRPGTLKREFMERLVRVGSVAGGVYVWLLIRDVV